jgi:uncharacterized membrane protein YbhN (UPF0104 family)
MLMLSAIVLFGHVLASGKLLLMTGVFQVRLSAWEALVLSEAGGLLNLIPLNPGTGLKAAYLKGIHGLNLTDFGLGFVSLLVSSLASGGLLGLLFGPLTGNLSPFIYFLFILYLCAPLLLVMLARLLTRDSSTQTVVTSEPHHWTVQLYRSILRGLLAILERPHAFLWYLVLDSLSGLCLGVRFWLVGIWLGYPIDFSSGIVVQSVTRLTAAFSFLPAGSVGVREALAGLATMGLGDLPVSGVMISTVDRIIAVGWLIVGGSIGLLVVRSKLAASLDKTAASAARDFNEQDSCCHVASGRR